MRAVRQQREHGFEYAPGADNQCVKSPPPHCSPKRTALSRLGLSVYLPFCGI
jgi:hypothetical protein